MADKNTNKHTDKHTEKNSNKAGDAARPSQAQQWPWMPGFPQPAAMPWPAPGMDEGVERFEAWMSEVDQISRTSAEQATKAIDESARLAKASLTYALELQTRAGSMWLDGLRKATASMQAGG